MTAPLLLSPADIEKIALVTIGEDWRRFLGEAVGVSRSRGYQIAKAGADKSQAAAFIGLISREIIRRREKHEAEDAALRDLLRVYEDRLG